MSRFVVASLALATSVLLAIRLGATDNLPTDLILELRFPRVLLAAAVGMGLGLAGLVLQSVFANPLCEPYTLGISSGGTLGVVLGIGLGFEFQLFGMVGWSFVGSLLAALIILILSFRTVSGLSLLLAGVMLSFLCSSLVALYMAVADSNGISGALSWLLGDLSRADSSVAFQSSVFIVVVSLVVWMKSTTLDAMLMGDSTAQALGVNVVRERRRLIVISSLLVAGCVSSVGMVGFVGLLVPHVVRRTFGSNHQSVIPLTALWGATVLVIADLVSRMIYPPFEIPIGVMTSLIGAPAFVLVFLGRKSLVV